MSPGALEPLSFAQLGFLLTFISVNRKFLKRNISTSLPSKKFLERKLMVNPLALRKTALTLFVALLTSLFSPIGSLNSSTPANAASVDFSGEYLNFDASTMVVLNGNSASPTVGLTLLYPSAGVIEGVAVDVTVELIAVTNSNNAPFSWDEPSDGQFSNVQLNQDQKDLIILSMGASSKPIEIVLRFRFWESGTVAYVSPRVSGVEVQLRNVLINTYDLDANQYVAFSGFQSYDLDVTTSIVVSQIAGTRLVKFLGPSGGMSGNDSFTIGRARVIYDQVSSVDIQIAAPSGALYGLQFGAGVDWPSSVRASNLFNGEPTSTDTTKYVVPGLSSALNLSDFGDYSDPDSNPFFDVKFEASSDLGGLQLYDGSSTISPSAGSTVSVETISTGRLSYLLAVSSPATVSFRVGDGLTYSATVYSLNLLPSTLPQEITFPEVLTPLDPNAGAFSSSATSSSGLQVTLTTNTPDVCSIDANGTDIVPLITNARTACSVTATQPGDQTYASAQPVTRTFYFSNQSITFPAISDQLFVSGGAISSSAVASSTLPVTLVSLTTAVCTVSGLDIQFVATGSCTVRAEQNGGTTGGVTYISAFPVVRSFQLTAFDLSYDANTGTGTTPAGLTDVNSATVGTGSLSKSGFDFAGWNSANDGSGNDYATGSSIALTADLTLYAKWVATITFDAQGGSAVASQQYIFGQAGISLPTSSKGGATLQGWSLTPTGAVLSGTYSSGSATLYAIWSDGESSPMPYTGPVVIQVSPNVVSTEGGELVTVTGKRLGQGQHVVIDGNQLPLSFSSPTQFSFLMPSLPQGVWDLEYTYDGGARLTIMRAITTVPPRKVESGADANDSGLTGEAQPKPWSAMAVASKFAPGSPVINRAVRAEVVKMLRKYSSIATHIDCTGFTMGPTVLRVDAKLSMDRAVNVCNLIKKLRPRLEVISMQGKQELRLGGEIRRVEVRFYRK